MSSYLLNPEHCAALAAYAVNSSSGADWIYGVVEEWRVKGGEHDKRETLKTVAMGLMVENIRGVAARYPESHGDLPGLMEKETTADLLDKTVHFAKRYYIDQPPLTAIDILAMVDCLDYQSCDSGDIWVNSIARKQLDLIQAKAIRCLPGYDKAWRDFEDTRKDNSSNMFLLGANGLEKVEA